MDELFIMSVVLFIYRRTQREEEVVVEMEVFGIIVVEGVIVEADERVEILVQNRTG